MIGSPPPPDWSPFIREEPSALIPLIDALIVGVFIALVIAIPASFWRERVIDRRIESAERFANQKNGPKMRQLFEDGQIAALWESPIDTDENYPSSGVIVIPDDRIGWRATRRLVAGECPQIVYSREGAPDRIESYCGQPVLYGTAFSWGYQPMIYWRDE